MVRIGRQVAGRERGSSKEAEKRRMAEIRNALTKTEGEGVGKQAEAVAEVMLAEPSQPTTDWMWRALIIGLFALLGIVLVALIAMIAVGKGTQVLSTIFGLIFGGLIGVFVPGPTTGTSS
jgi:hypothetical protein